MAGSSRPPILALLALLLCGGCVSGRLFEAGRVSESVVAYERAHVRETALVVAYTVQVESALGGTRGRAERAARIPLEALAADPPHPVDSFPLEPVRRDHLQEGEEPAELEILPGDGVPAGFRLCEPLRGDCLGPFYSGALYRDRTAWWVWPVLPAAAVADVLLMPVHLVMTAPFFLLGD